MDLLVNKSQNERFVHFLQGSKVETKGIILSCGLIIGYGSVLFSNRISNKCYMKKLREKSREKWGVSEPFKIEKGLRNKNFKETCPENLSVYFFQEKHLNMFLLDLENMFFLSPHFHGSIALLYNLVSI